MTIPRHLRTVWMLLVPLSWIAATSVHAQRRDDSPWSVSPSAALSLDPASWVQDMIAAGVRSVRGFSRPEPIAAAGLGLTGILTVPNAQARQTFPIDDLPGYRRYVTREVTRYKGIVRYWEVWNEPPNFSEDQSPASYARIVAAAYDAAKAVDPTVQIGLSAKSVHLGFMAEALDAGARGKYDYITLHPYETASLLQDNWEGPFLGIVPTLRTMLKDKDPARAKVPVWFTEIGVEVAEQGRQGVSLAEQADLLVKIYAMSLAQGVTRVSWFAPRDSEGTTHGLSWANGERKPAFNAYETITQSLGPAPQYVGAVDVGADGYGFLFKAPRGYALIAWAKPGATVAYTLGTVVRVVDPATKRSWSSDHELLTPSPKVFVLEGLRQPKTSFGRLAAQRLPAWDSEVRSPTATVELVAGHKPRGIHMVNAPAVRTVDGRSEFDLSDRPSTRFAVDPSLMRYKVGKLKITIVVRGHGGTPPGFSLKYESTTPLSKVDGNGLVSASGWVNVQGTQPVTMSWDIDNARFVGMYGFNLMLDSDSIKHSDYSLISVSISKR